MPRWLEAEALTRESLSIEQFCWRELGYSEQPVFEGDLPTFLMEAENGAPRDLTVPMLPVELARRLAAVRPSALPSISSFGANMATLGQLLNLSACESQWLIWGCCVRRYGRAILPVIPTRDDEHACEMLAVLFGTPADMVLHAVSSGRLHAWGFLDDGCTRGETPSFLSGWLSATEQFADWIEQPYASDSDLLTALCQAQVS